MVGKSSASGITDPKFSSIPSKVACYVPTGEVKHVFKSPFSLIPHVLSCSFCFQGGFDPSQMFSKSEQERKDGLIIFWILTKSTPKYFFNILNL